MATKNSVEQNLMQDLIEQYLHPAHISQKCGAKTRGTGAPCENFAAHGYTRCRLHGGAPGSGRPPTHGRRTQLAQRQAKLATLLKRILNHFYEKPEPVESVKIVYDTGGHAVGPGGSVAADPRQVVRQAPPADGPEPAAAAGAVQGSGQRGA